MSTIDPDAFHQFSVLTDGQKFPITVWNGKKDYHNQPSPGLMEYMGLLSNPGGPLVILQLSKCPKSTRAIFDRFPEGCSGVVIWAKNSKTFNAIVKLMKEGCVYINPGEIDTERLIAEALTLKGVSFAK